MKHPSLFRSAIIVVAMRWTDRLIGFISTLVLARLLLPQDFGIVAMAVIAAGLVDVLLDLGVVVALVQKRGADHDDFSTAWTLRLLQSLLIAAILFTAAPMVAAYFNEARVAPVLRVMALATVVGGFENIGVVSFQKEMKFGREFQFLFLRRVIGFVVTVALALTLKNYWALTLGALAGRAAGVWLSYALHPFRPRLTLARLRSIWSFSQWMLVRSVGVYLEGRLDRLLIGRRSDASVVGAYTLADEIAAIPSTELLMPVGRALFPALVNARDQPERMCEIYLLALALQVMIATPAAAGLALVAPEAVQVLLGSRWMEAVPFVEVLALVYGVTAISHGAGYLLLTLGKVRGAALLVWVQIAAFALAAAFLFPSARAIDLAWLRLAMTAAGAVGMVALALGSLEILRLSDILAVLWRPMIGAILMALGLYWLSLPDLPVVVALILRCVAGAVIYIVTIALLWRLSGSPAGGESYAMEKIATLLRRRSPPRGW